MFEKASHSQMNNNLVATNSQSATNEANDRIIPNDSPTQSSVILYENDFDLYNLLKDMNTFNSKTNAPIFRRSSASSPTQPQKPRRKNFFRKNVTKSLTARLLDSHFTNGKSEWTLIENGMDLYRSKVKCIGTDMKDCGNGEAVSLDLQPLSTRIKLMCKLIIIIQGACIERSGPPKLVQDRCLQFDGDVDNTQSSQLNEATKIKSSSCENLLNDLNGSHLTKNEIIIEDTKVTV